MDPSQENSSSNLHQLLRDYYKLDTPEFHVAQQPSSFLLTDLNNIDFNAEQYFSTEISPKLNLKALNQFLQVLNSGNILCFNFRN